MPGLTAYGSLKEVAKPKAGETIYVSTASGAVGQLVGQLAKLQGLRVVGSAGSDAKVEYLIKKLKFDAAFNYKNGPILESLRKAAPEGIDIYYDNVGAEHLEAALEVLNDRGRIVGKLVLSSKGRKKGREERDGRGRGGRQKNHCAHLFLPLTSISFWWHTE